VTAGDPEYVDAVAIEFEGSVLAGRVPTAQ
jgi:hypothetical protein